VLHVFENVMPLPTARLLNWCGARPVARTARGSMRAIDGVMPW